VVLVLAKNKDCKHLARDNKCGIYALRPDACSHFPVGSECCLSAREEEMGIIDGATA
jgi:Fe-S-cluster containining protein